MGEARLTVWSEAECRRLHEATLELLADTGVDVRYEPALELFRAAGASVDGRRVRIPARLVDDAVASAPREWLLKPRGGETEPLNLRDGEVHYGTGSDVLYVRDPESGERRRVRRADVEGMAALCEKLPQIDFIMSMGLPEDAPQGIDDLVQVVAMLRGTRKPLLVAPRDGSVLARMQEMAALCGEKESFAIYAMPSPPLMHDPDALTKVIGCAELLIPLIYAPAPNMGATGPRSITGAVLVGNAETLSGLVLHQHVNRGAPFVYGVGCGAMDMRTMTDPYVSPDALLAQQVGTDMARHYGLPSFSYAGMSDSKLLDEQWSAEAALSMAYGSLSRATLLHDVGYLESGLQSSYESIVLGDELVGYARQFMREVPVDDYSPRARGDPGRRPRRQPSRDQVHAPAPPGVLDAGAARPQRPRPLGGGGGYDARPARPRAPRGPARRGAPVPPHGGPGRAARRPARRGGGRPRSSSVRTAGPQDQGESMKTRFKGRTWRHPGNQALVLLVLALLLLLAAAPLAAASDSASPAAAEGTTFRVGWLLEPDNLNPFIGLLGQDYEIWHLNYDFLVGFDAKDLSPKPELAESWEVSEDGKTWTFKIREGVKWQDDVPLTAKDVAFTFNYIVDNNLQTLAIYTGGITGAKAVDDTTVEITTEQPKSNMLAMVVPIIPEHIWSKVSGDEATTSFQNKPPIIGSGPFQVVEWNKGKYIRLEANKDYWGGAPKIDTLLFENYKSADTMTADLKQGTIDAAVELPQAQYPSVESTEGVTGLKGTHWRFNELGFNCYDSPDSMGNPVLLDEKFRSALNWAIDRQKIVDVAFFGQADVGSTLIVPYSPYHWEPAADQAYTYDPEEAKTQLDLAGYEDTDGDGVRETKDGKPLSLRLYVTNDSPENQTAAKLITGWFEDVGLDITLKIVDAGVLLDAQYNYKGDTYAPDYDMFIWFWTYDVDPEMMLGVPTPQQIEGWNDTLWTNDEYTQLFDEQRQTIAVEDRIPLVQRMQEIVWESSPYLIFAYPYQLEAYRSDKWQGVVPSPSDYEGYDGAAFYNYMNVDTYKQVQPVVATENVESESSSTTLIIVIVVAAVVVAALIVWMMLRRREPLGGGVTGESEPV